MKGVVGSSRSNSWISKVIRWFRDAKVSHTFIIINGRGDEPLFVLEAGKREVLIVPFEQRYCNDYVELYAPLVNYNKVNSAVDKVLPYIEKRYGYLQILGFALVSLLKKIGIKIKNPIGTGIICSELVLLYLRELELAEFKKLNRDTIAPDDLLQIIQKSKNFKKVTL